jgi:hypothetical protein
MVSVAGYAEGELFSDFATPSGKRNLPQRGASTSAR